MSSAAIDHIVRDLVIANRILARENVIDDFGHVSVRHPLNPSHFFLSRARSPEIVDAIDILEFDRDGEPIDARGQKPYAERALHAALFQARPDVQCVVHHHARAVLSFCISDMPLKPVFHMASIIGHDVPRWDSQDDFGDTNMLVDNLAKGQSMARALGQNSTMLLARHGACCVGSSIQEAVFTAIYMKENAELILQSRSCGPLSYLTKGEIDQTAALLRTDICQTRSWDYRKARAGFRGL
jgi:HCOMODA/2-hydroxy-3-carboxy-muconic semialdehyde decarboxylase